MIIIIMIITIHAYVYVTDAYILHMITAGFTQALYLIVPVIPKIVAVCVNAMRCLQRLLHLAG